MRPENVTVAKVAGPYLSGPRTLLLAAGRVLRHLAAFMTSPYLGEAARDVPPLGLVDGEGVTLIPPHRSSNRES